MNNQKITLQYKLSLLTPVHVGGAQESHYQPGIDFVKGEDKIIFLDEKKIIAAFGIDKYATWLADRQLEREIKRQGVGQFALKTMQYSSGTNTPLDIRKNIRSQGTDQLLIPGSSLKGALRSVLFNWAKNGSGPQSEAQVFGNISEDPFRFIQAPDIAFDKSMLVNTKIFNLQKNDWDQWEGGWKHGRNTSHQFDDSSFTTLYECIATGSSARLQLQFNRNARVLAGNNVTQRLDNLLFAGQPEDLLFEIIQRYTITYLQRELAFFQKYQERVAHADSIVRMYTQLLHTAQKSNLALLRIGQGSGFHAMTGDWKYTNHIDPVEIRTLEGKPNRPVHLKSRKLGFIKTQSGVQLFPLGFLQLSRIPAP